MAICQQANVTATLDVETREQPVAAQKSKCFCFPRRCGIIVLALIKLMLSLFLLLNLINNKFEGEFGDFLFPSWLYTILTWITIFINVVDIIFGLVLMTSVCMKNGRIMKIYYINSFFVLGSLSFLCCITCYIMFLFPVGLLILFSILFLVTMLQMYLNHLVKCEVLNLERGEEIQLS